MTVPVADTKHVNAFNDWLALQEEAVALAERILAELRKPEAHDIHWGHVGDMAHARTTLRELSNSMFNEGEYAHAAGTAANCESYMRSATNGERGCSNPAEHAS